MRDKSVCSAYAVKEHFEENIVPNLDKMKAVTPNAPLLKTVRILFICLADVRIFFAQKCYVIDLIFFSVTGEPGEKIVYCINSAQ